MSVGSGEEEDVKLGGDARREEEVRRHGGGEWKDGGERKSNAREMLKGGEVGWEGEERRREG